MLEDIDRIGPQLILMVAAGGVLFADILLRDRNRGGLPVGVLGALTASAARWLYGERHF